MAVPGRKAHSRVSCSSGEDFEIFCHVCDRDNIRLQAFGFCVQCQEHLCETCFNHHKRATPFRHHTLLDKQNMPQNLQDPSQAVDAGPSDDHTIPCAKHKKELIKFYCQGHETLFCNECAYLGHTHKSCQVKYIPYTSTCLEKVDTEIRKYKKINEHLKKQTTASNQSLTGVFQEIKKFRQDINQRLDELEKEAGDMVKVRQEENEQRLKTAEETIDDITKSLTATSDFIKQLNDSKQTDRLFMELIHVEQLIEDNQKKMLLLALPKDVGEYYFIQNPEIAKCLLKEKYLGSFMSFSYQEDIPAQTSSNGRCWTTGITLLTPYKLLLVDNYNRAIKMVNLNENSVTDQLQLDINPWDIATVTSNQAAVTLPNMETIQFISASSNKLSLKHKLKVDGKCSGISCYEEKLVVTFLDPGKLQIIDLNGKVLISVTTDQSGENIFSLPRYVTSNSHSIYVSDARMHSVIRLNWHGELTGHYGGMDDPRGITMLEDGSILVCDCFRNNLHHISGDLSNGNVVLKDRKKPHAICWYGTNCKLYTSHISLDANYANFIQVFKMS